MWRFLCFLVFVFVVSCASAFAEPIFFERGFTVYIAFNEKNGAHGWGFNTIAGHAKNKAMGECGRGCKVVVWQTNGYVAFVHDGERYAYGHNAIALGVEGAYKQAVDNWAKHHPGCAPTEALLLRSDGYVFPAFDVQRLIASATQAALLTPKDSQQNSLGREAAYDDSGVNVIEK